MSEISRRTAIARGKGEGVALGYQMSSSTALSSHTQVKNYCIKNANTEGMACMHASVYVDV